MKSKKKILFYFSVFISSGLIYSLILALWAIYPFGEKNNLIVDLSIQYVELFEYLRDVLKGDASILYTFTKSLGGSSIDLFSYYLASPINLLIIFFQQENLQMFFYVIMFVKIGLCGTFQAFFLKNVYPELGRSNIYTLSLCYAVSYYTVSQLDNVMWFDGVYMLPLILYGVWKLHTKKEGWILSITVGFSIVFNWYTAYMNCLFATVFFFYIVLKETNTWRMYLKNTLNFISHMIFGVMLSCALFLPTIYALRGGKGSVEESIFSFLANGNIFHLLRGLVIGNDPGSQYLSLFCGSIVLIFLSIRVFSLYHERKKREFILEILLITVMLFSMFLKPLENIWNGFRYATSYMYRFSYIQTWMFIYIAAAALCDWKKSKTYMLKIALGYILFWFLLDYIQPFEPKRLYLTVITLLLIVLFFIFKDRKDKKISSVVTFGICCITILELVANGVCVVKNDFTWGEAKSYRNYVMDQKELISVIDKSTEKEFYRMEQTYDRGMNPNKCSPFFLESMAYGYHGFSHYTSTFNENMRKFSEQLGYGTNNTMTMYDEPILTSDSLFGIKYIMAEMQYPALNLVDSMEKNRKKIYKNPYSLPLGFLVSEKSLDSVEEKNHFEFQNQVFSNLLGYQVKLYEPVEYNTKQENNTITYTMDLGEDAILYGYADSEIQDLPLYIDGIYRCNYERWLSYKVFNISENSGEHQVRFENYKGKKEQIKPKFYQMNLKVFEQSIDLLRNQAFEVEQMKDGFILGKIESSEDGYMLLSVPMEEGWQGYVNGKEINLEYGANALMLVPVTSGLNIIKLTYSVPYLKLGVIISILTIISIFVLYKKGRKICYQ